MLSFLGLCTLMACDAVKQIPAPYTVVSNIPEKPLITILGQYPNAKNYISEELNTNLWSVRFEQDGRNKQITIDEDGAVITENEILGTNYSFPSTIIEYLQKNHPGAALSKIAKVYSPGADGFELEITDNEQFETLQFDQGGKFLKKLDENTTLQKIINTNSANFLEDTAIPVFVKELLKSLSLKKFEATLIEYGNEKSRIIIVEKDGQLAENQKIEFHVLSGKIQKKLEYLRPEKLKQVLIKDINSFNLNPKDELPLNDAQFKYGLMDNSFGLNNSRTLVYSDAQANQLVLSYASQTSKPSIVWRRKLTADQIPTTIKYQLLSENVGVSTAIEQRAYQKSLIDKNLQAIDYYIWTEKSQNAKLSKKLYIFDQNLNRKN